MTDAPRTTGRSIPAIFEILPFLWKSRRTLLARVRLTFAERYANSLLGLTWVFLFPILFLSIYVLVYLAIFRVRLGDGGPMEYVLYAFSGLVPYWASMEALNGSVTSVRSELAAVRSAFTPIELVPARVVFVAMATELIGLVFVVAMGVWADHLTPNIILLPVALVIQALFLIGLAFILATAGAILRDIGYGVPLLTMLFMFISPVLYPASMVPAALRFMVDWNPVYYLLAPFRMALFETATPDIRTLGIAALIALVTLAAGCSVLRRYRGIVTDHA